jgi:hypothetical protein
MLTWTWTSVDHIFSATCVAGSFVFAELRHHALARKNKSRPNIQTLLNYSSDLWNTLTIITLVCFAIILAVNSNFIKDFVEAQRVPLCLSALFVVRFTLMSFRFPP